MSDSTKMIQCDEISTEVSSVCYLCNKQGTLLYRDLVDYLFCTSGVWNFRKCSNPECGLIWLDPRPTLNEIGKAYRNYYTHGQKNNEQQTRLASMVRSIFHKMSIIFLGLRVERLRYKCMYLDQLPAGRLLEVGCGNGKRLARLQALGWDVIGQEVDPVASEYARKIRGMRVHTGPLETMEVSEKYDAVIMSHVIEHVHDPISLLAACSNRILKKNGLLILLTPNVASYGHRKFGATWRGLEPPRHLHLFTCKTLIQISQKAGFNLQRCWTTPVGANGIGQSSLLSAENIKQGHLLITTSDVLRGLWFQIAACRVFLTDKNSGEECVLIATN